MRHQWYMDAVIQQSANAASQSKKAVGPFKALLEKFRS